ncbi:MAG: hypothetical protein ACE14P_13870 [Methanotrichaceae archaeon]
MESRSIVLIALLSSILLTACYAQSTGSSQGGFQSVGEDFGKAWLSNFKAQNPEPVENTSKSNGLWSWGTAPKGRSIINGQLMVDPYYYWKSLNLSSGWLGQAYVDNKTGAPVYAYIDPYTGYPDYFYMDPKSGSPVYINPASASGSNSGVSSNYLPPWLSMQSNNNYPSDYPWLGMPYGTDGSGVSDVYGSPNSGMSSYYGYNSGGGIDYGGMGMV